MVKVLNPKYCCNSHIKEMGADIIAPLMKSAIVEKNCGEHLTGGRKKHARLKPSFPASWGLHPKEERPVRLILMSRQRLWERIIQCES